MKKKLTKTEQRFEAMDARMYVHEQKTEGFRYQIKSLQGRNERQDDKEREARQDANEKFERRCWFLFWAGVFIVTGILAHKAYGCF